MKEKHCDEYINDKSQPKCLRKFLLYNRIPELWKFQRWKKSWGVPVLFAEHKPPGGGKRWKKVRVVMASRFGDVGITRNLDAEHGYEQRIYLEDLRNFKDKEKKK